MAQRVKVTWFTTEKFQGVIEIPDESLADYRESPEGYLDGVLPSLEGNDDGYFSLVSERDIEEREDL